MAYHLGPAFVSSGNVIKLKPMPLDNSGTHTESTIQNLIHDAPDIIPMDEIEPAYRGMIPLCTELPLSAGFLDNLWMTKTGGIVIGECKLFRNSQARREVIAQALDYARCFQKLSYESFESAIGKARGESNFKLWNFLNSVKAEVETTNEALQQDIIPEARFIDLVSKKLKRASILVLIIGDGIREELSDLTEFLQMHAGVHANLALIDLSLWKDDSGRMLVIPRLPMKTEVISRGIVQIDERNPSVDVIDPPDRAISCSSSNTNIIRRTPRGASAEQFFSMLNETSPASVEIIERMIGLLKDTDVEVRYSSQYVIFDMPLRGKYIKANKSALDFKYDGVCWGGSLVADKFSDEAKVLKSLLTELAEALGANITFTEQNYHRFKMADGKPLQILNMKGREERIAEALSKIALHAKQLAASADR